MKIFTVWCAKRTRPWAKPPSIEPSSLLTEAGLAREVRFGDGRAHYEHNYKHQHHDHMICSECGKIIEFYSAELEAIQDAMAAKIRFELTEHLLRMIGICADCRREKREPRLQLTGYSAQRQSCAALKN